MQEVQLAKGRLCACDERGGYAHLLGAVIWWIKSSVKSRKANISLDDLVKFDCTRKSTIRRPGHRDSAKVNESGCRRYRSVVWRSTQ